MDDLWRQQLSGNFSIGNPLGGLAQSAYDRRFRSGSREEIEYEAEIARKRQREQMYNQQVTAPLEKELQEEEEKEKKQSMKKADEEIYYLLS